jgi:tetratricopeptide (TPR) repeat protein
VGERNMMIDLAHSRLIRRLTAAEGYLELDLPDYALEELERIEDPGPYTGVVDWLSGEAFREKQDYNAAIERLQRAVRDIPVPHNRAAVHSLTACLRNTGRDDLADAIEKYAAVAEELSDEEIHVEFPIESAGRDVRLGTDDDVEESPQNFENN